MSDEATIAIEEASVTRESRRRLTIDLASSYALSFARVGSMAAMVALYFRHLNAEYAATFILIRTMLGVLNNLFSGVGPATQRTLAERPPTLAVATVEPVADGSFLSYRSANKIARVVRTDFAGRFATIVGCTFVAYLIASVVVFVYAIAFTSVHEVAITRREAVAPFVAAYGAGVLIRLLTEPAGAVLQLRGRLALDNLIQVVGECAWPLFCWFGFSASRGAFVDQFPGTANVYLLVSVAVALARGLSASIRIGSDATASIAVFDGPVRTFLQRSGIAAIGSLADCLYAPVNLLIISACIHPIAVADYTPALQFDAALLLLVGAIATTLLPRAMRLAGENDRTALQALYTRSLAASFAILVAASFALWAAAPTIIRLWLGRPMPVTLAILPLVLVHTVVGGTAGIGRAVLLGMGRFKAYTVSALVGGVANVLLAMLFVLGFGWGLRGIVCATIVAVVGRCAIWMPWYILRALREGSAAGDPAAQRPA